MVKMVNLAVILLTFLYMEISLAADPKLMESDNKLCLSCHEEDSFQKKYVHFQYVHFPIEYHCTLCHNSHTSKYQFLLLGETYKLCYFCHSREEKKFSQSAYIHTIVAQGKCTGCHNPHASDNKYILHSKGEELCYSCHQQEAEDFKKGTIHLPVGNGECSSCHDPHASATKGQLLNSLQQLCFTCHDQQEEAYKEAHKRYPVGKSNCLGCHTPHASVVKGDHLTDGLFLSYIHAPFGEKSCDDCHVSSDSPEPLQLIAKETEFCYICHGDIEDEVNSKVHVHLPVKDGNCAGCHAPHASPAEHLLLAPGKDLCVKCHADLMPKLTATYVHEPVAQGRCAECHLPHASEDESLLLNDSIALCVSCHETQGKFTHPVGPKAIDPNTKKPMTCVSCHDAHGSEYEAVLVADGERDLCLQCHKLPTAAKVSKIH